MYRGLIESIYMVYLAFRVVIGSPPRKITSVARKERDHYIGASSTVANGQLAPVSRPKFYTLMTRDSFTLVEEVWCTFDTHEEVSRARDALNQVFEGSRSFWCKEDEPPVFSHNPQAFSEYIKNFGAPGR